MCGKSAYDWNTVLTGRLCGGRLSMRRPRSQIVPSVGPTKRPIRLSVVVLPQPDGPRRQKNSPSRISRSTPLSATLPPYRFVTPRSSIPARPDSASEACEAGVAVTAIDGRDSTNMRTGCLGCGILRGRGRGADAVCIERLDGLRVQSLMLRLGGSLPLHLGAGPRTLLAWEPREEWEAYVGHGPLEAMTDKTPVSREALFRELEHAVEQGYAVSDEDVTPGIASLGAPIFDYKGRVRAAISIGGMRQFMLDEIYDEAVELLVTGAREVSTALGYERSPC